MPASEVLHIYRPIDAGQLRGLPHVAPAMVRLFLLDQYDDAELDRKKTAAMFAGFITKTAPEEALLGGVEAAEDGTGTVSLEPGTLQVLLPGEDVKFSSPADVGGGFEAFQYRTLLAVSASLGLPYHLVTGDVRQANYSSLRAELVEFRRRVEQLQHGVIAFQLCRPVWQRWLDAAVLAGALDVPATARLTAPGAMDPATVGLGRSAEGHPGAGARHRVRPALAPQGGRGDRLRHRRDRPGERGRRHACRGPRSRLPHEPRRDAGGAGDATADPGPQRGVTACGLGTRSAPSPRARRCRSMTRSAPSASPRKSFLDEIGALPDEQRITLRINSPGGSVFDAVAIHNALKRHPAGVTVWIDGIAASAASYIAMAGDEVVMPANAFLMIHDPSGMVLGTADDMRAMAEALDKIKTSLVAGYAAKSGGTDADIAELMRKETWFDAEEAVALGFVDRVAEPGPHRRAVRHRSLPQRAARAGRGGRRPRR